MSSDRAASIAEIDSSLTTIGQVARSRNSVRLRQKRSGVSLPETTVAALAAVYRHGPLRIGAVGDHIELDASRTSREVRRLVDEGLVSQNVDPGERRASILTITPKGRRTFERYRTAATDLVNRAFAGWSAEDLAAAASVLSRIADTFSR